MHTVYTECCCVSVSPSVPSDPPQNVTISDVTHTSFNLSWSPPTQPNGILQHYTLYYSNNDTLYTQVSPTHTHTHTYLAAGPVFQYSAHSLIFRDLEVAADLNSQWVQLTVHQPARPQRSTVLMASKVYIYTKSHTHTDKHT